MASGDTFAPDKEIHYRMHPANLPALAVARPDARPGQTMSAARACWRPWTR
ncbi:hypothetical protein SVIOM74S_09216 [Streptomyces violarus]